MKTVERSLKHRPLDKRERKRGGQEERELLRERVGAMRARVRDVTVVRIPAHVGYGDHDAVDEAAKNARDGNDRQLYPLSTLRMSRQQNRIRAREVAAQRFWDKLNEWLRRVRSGSGAAAGAEVVSLAQAKETLYCLMRVLKQARRGVANAVVHVFLCGVSWCTGVVSHWRDCQRRCCSEQARLESGQPATSVVHALACESALELRQQKLQLALRAKLYRDEQRWEPEAQRRERERQSQRRAELRSELTRGDQASRERVARELLTSIEGVLELLPYLFALGDRRRTVPAAAPAVAAGGGESPQARARRRGGEDVVPGVVASPGRAPPPQPRRH